MSGLSLLARILFSKTCALRSTVPSAATSAFFVLLGISCSEPYSLTCHFASHSRPSLAQCLTFIPVVGRCRVTSKKIDTCPFRSWYCCHEDWEKASHSTLDRLVAG